MNLLKKVTLSDPFWNSYEHDCDNIMIQFETREENSIDEDYSNLREMIHMSLAETLNKHKPLVLTLTARLKTNQNILDLRMRKNHLYRMKKQYSNPEIKRLIIDEVIQVSNSLKKEIRQEREKFRKEQMKRN